MAASSPGSAFWSSIQRSTLRRIWSYALVLALTGAPPAVHRGTRAGFPGPLRGFPGPLRHSSVGAPSCGAAAALGWGRVRQGGGELAHGLQEGAGAHGPAVPDRVLDPPVVGQHRERRGHVRAEDLPLQLAALEAAHRPAV